MNKLNKEWIKEEERINYVIEKIDEKVSVIEQHLSEKQKEIVDIRKNFWNDVSVNFEDTIETAETLISIKQQAEVLKEKERRQSHDLREYKTLQKLLYSPYFGRIDFLEKNESTSEQIYIGIATFLDNDESILVYDWRAPISSLYYDYSLGLAMYNTPLGRITGEIKLKRQFIIHNGQMNGMFDTGITIGDELLQEVLGKNSDFKMKSIVATIQKEQNLIIRNERSKLLIVSGPAGSGKTSAALQRVAYLLYRYRDTISGDNIMLFSPNKIFNSYVSTVLPELGEENMQQTTFQEYLEYRIGKLFKLEDPYLQTEYVLTSIGDQGYEVRLEGIKYKATIAFKNLMDKYIQLLGQKGLIFVDIEFRNKILISSKVIEEQFYTLDSALSIPNRMLLLKDWLLKELKKYMKIERTKKWIEDEIQYLDRKAYTKVYRELSRKNKYTEDTFDDFAKEQEMLIDIVLKQYFKPLSSFVKQYGFIDTPKIYCNLFKDNKQFLDFMLEHNVPNNWSLICIETIKKVENMELASEDTTPYLYLKDKLEGFTKNTSIRYVFIDEAQDYSPFQFAFIKEMFPFSKITAVGDMNQAIYAHTYENENLESLTMLYKKEETEEITLSRSYRSTKQIIEFTKGMIKGGELIQTFNREGRKPVIKRIKYNELNQNIIQQVKVLKTRGYKTIAIICKTSKESMEAYKLLQADIALTLITKDSTNFETGTFVIPTYLAKGLEFDAVIIFNGSSLQYCRENEQKLLYTACTRAMHELYIYSVGELSPFFYNIHSDTYILEN